MGKDKGQVNSIPGKRSSGRMRNPRRPGSTIPGLLVAVMGFCLPAAAGEGLWSLGPRTQGFYDFEPGQDLFHGPEIGYSNYNLAGHRLQLKLAYLTSRLENVFRENILRQDYFLFSPVWHFGRNRLFDPTIQMDMGYWRYDVEYNEFQALDNSSWIASAQAGFALNFYQGEYGLFYHFGYELIVPESGMVLPGVFGVGFWVML